MINFIWVFLGSLIFYLLTYASISGFFYWLFWHRNLEAWSHRKSQNKPLRKGQIKREVLTTVRSIVIFSLMTVGGWWFISQGWTNVYLDVNEYSGWWFFASFLIYFYAHDAWFYWTHRMMHHKLFYKWMHAEHHKSVNPTPWACYSFSVFEALVQGAIFLILIFFIPIHPLSFALIAINLQLFNTLGHLGFEYNPRWWINSWLSHFYNTPTHHNMHHQYFKADFGLYLNVWDRLMDTNFKNYRTTLIEMTEKPLLNEELKGEE